MTWPARAGPPCRQPGCEVERRSALGALIGALVGEEQVKLGAYGHGIPAERVLPGQEIRDDGAEGHAALLLRLRWGGKGVRRSDRLHARRGRQGWGGGEGRGAGGACYPDGLTRGGCGGCRLGCGGRDRAVGGA